MIYLRNTQTLSPGQRIEVYRDLNRNGWTLRDKATGEKIGYTEDDIALVNAVFIVELKGREESRQTRKHTIHAWIEGDYRDQPGNIETMEPVTYHPRSDYPYFTTRLNTPVFSSPLAILARDKAYIPPQDL